MSYRSGVGALEMVPPPTLGRRFEVRRRVRLGDASPRGRVRLDALARYLQDIANDDARDAGAEGRNLHGWVVRRTVIDVREFPRYLGELTLTTWIGGLGAGWAERRTRILDADGAVRVDASALWVHVDTRTLRPQRLSPELQRLWGDASGGRRIRASTVLDPAALGPMPAEHSALWPLRYSDFDGFGHMNNAAYWEIVEEHFVSHGDHAPVRCVVEHLEGVVPGDAVTVTTHRDDGDFALCITAEAATATKTAATATKTAATATRVVKAMCFVGRLPV